MRQGLQDYFHASVNREHRLVDVYVLSLASNAKLPPAKPPDEEGMGGSASSSSITVESPVREMLPYLSIGHQARTKLRLQHSRLS
jgi:hypothetical protein